MIRPKVLLITLPVNSYGGVVSYNNGVLQSDNIDIIQFRNYSGKYDNFILKAFFLIIDIFRLSIKLITKNINIVHINPSLSFNSFLRDSIFVLVSKRLSKRVVVQWHGWNPANNNLTKGLFLKWLKVTFFKADHTKFLYQELIDNYELLGYKKKISLGKTFVSSTYEDNMFKVNHNSKNIRLLFLSTVSINKGIYKAISLFEILKKSHVDLELKIAGKGPAFNEVSKFVKDKEGIEMLGYVSGNIKSEVFQNSDIYLFPSDYEGMPISVLEAMYFGLPILATKVGALHDFFEESLMGYTSNQDSYVDVMQKHLEFLIKNNKTRKKIGIYNTKFITENFMLKNVLFELENDYKNILNEK
ncbi:glycosyltransferase [Flavobacteriaceae bacterium]|nr:glycosyltransferase [Flavobacteriaceae bacterium]